MIIWYCIAWSSKARPELLSLLSFHLSLSFPLFPSSHSVTGSKSWQHACFYPGSTSGSLRHRRAHGVYYNHRICYCRFNSNNHHRPCGRYSNSIGLGTQLIDGHLPDRHPLGRASSCGSRSTYGTKSSTRKDPVLGICRYGRSSPCTELTRCFRQLPSQVFSILYGVR